MTIPTESIVLFTFLLISKNSLETPLYIIFNLLAFIKNLNRLIIFFLENFETVKILVEVKILKIQIPLLTNNYD